MFVRGRSARISHVGIYVGEGRMIHASTAQRRVIETALPSSLSSMKLRTVRPRPVGFLPRDCGLA